MTAPIDGVWTHDQLVEAEARGDRLKFVFFWGHTPRSDGELGPHVFSQWYESSFSVDGLAYPTAEHFMMASKARLFGDTEIETQVLAAPSPGAAKALGRRVRGFDSATWDANSLDIVTTGSIAKFDADQDLRAYLVGTGNRVLVEASPVDRIWGIGLAADDRDATVPSAWQGKNLLGIALMRARAVLSGRC